MARWHSRKRFSNPYYTHTRSPRRWWVWWIGAAVPVIGIIGVLISPVFAVSDILVTEPSPVPVDQIQQIVRQNIAPWDRLPWVRTDRIEELLRETTSTEQIKVKKQYPHTLVVEITPRTSRAVWDAGASVVLLDETGKILSTTSPETTPGDLPRFIDESQAPVPPDFSIPTGIYARALEWIPLLTTDLQLSLTAVHFTNQTSTWATFRVHNAWDILIDLETTPETQFIKLRTILEDIRLNQKRIQTIDVRFADRVYYQ